MSNPKTGSTLSNLAHLITVARFTFLTKLYFKLTYDADKTRVFGTSIQKIWGVFSRVWEMRRKLRNISLLFLLSKQAYRSCSCGRKLCWSTYTLNHAKGVGRPKTRWHKVAVCLFLQTKLFIFYVRYLKCWVVHFEIRPSRDYLNHSKRNKSLYPESESIQTFFYFSTSWVGRLTHEERCAF